MPQQIPRSGPTHHPGWRIDHFPGRAPRALGDGHVVLPLWLVRTGAEVHDIGLTLSRYEAERLSADLRAVLDRSGATSTPSPKESPKGSARYCQVCEVCAERSEPDEDPCVGYRWARAHVTRRPGHREFCEEVTRVWATGPGSPR